MSNHHGRCMWAEWKRWGDPPDEVVRPEVAAVKELIFGCAEDPVISFQYTWTSEREFTDFYVLCQEHAARAMLEYAFDMARIPEFTPERWVIEAL